MNEQEQGNCPKLPAWAWWVAIAAFPFSLVAGIAVSLFRKRTPMKTNRIAVSAIGALCMASATLGAMSRPSQQARGTTLPPVPQSVELTGVTESSVVVHWVLPSTKSVTNIIIRVFLYWDDGTVGTNAYNDASVQSSDSFTATNLPSSTLIGVDVSSQNNK